VGGGPFVYWPAAAAKMVGAEVYVSDISESKLQFVKELGVDGTILNTSEEAFNEQVKEITGGNGFDVCIEAVGLPSTFMNCINAAAFRARIAVVGIGKQSLDFFYSIIQTKELDIFGSRNALKEDFEELIDFVKDGKANLEPIASAVYEFGDAEKAFKETAELGAQRLKVLIHFE